MNGVCSHKKDCIDCTMVSDSDRPTLCEMAKCPIYTPCSKCHQNKNVKRHEGVMLCYDCKVATKREADKIERRKTPEDILMESMAIDQKKDEKVVFSVPGVPPPFFTEEESSYYNSQWSLYIGKYRDPTCFAVIHNLILAELELTSIGSQMSQFRGDAHAELRKRQSTITDVIADLRKMLPNEQADELSSREAILSLIYGQYLKVKQRRTVGNARQYFSPHAIALNPVIDFPANLQGILKRLGYEIADIQEVMASIEGQGLANLPENPKALAIQLGFPIDEEFAVNKDDDFERMLLDSDE